MAFPAVDRERRILKGRPPRLAYCRVRATDNPWRLGN